MGDTPEKKKDYVKMMRNGARMKTNFFQMNFSPTDHALAQSVEVSRGVTAASIAFSKVLFQNNIFPSDAKIFRLGEEQSEDDSDVDDGAW